MSRNETHGRLKEIGQAKKPTKRNPIAGQKLLQQQMTSKEQESCQSDSALYKINGRLCTKSIMLRVLD